MSNMQLGKAVGVDECSHPNRNGWQNADPPAAQAIVRRSCRGGTLIGRFTDVLRPTTSPRREQQTIRCSTMREPSLAGSNRMEILLFRWERMNFRHQRLQGA
jgi:hypothetical protein